MLKKLLIYGAGGFGKEVLVIAKAINNEHPTWDEIYFIDDNIQEAREDGIHPISFNSVINYFDKNICEIIVACGEPKIKKDLYLKIQNYGFKITTLIHPKISCASFQNIDISPGVIIAEGVVLTTNIKIAKGVILNINSTVGHNVQIGEFSTISPGCNISGAVIIGDGVYIGSGCNIRDEITIGNNSIIGIGSIVVNDIESNSIAYGNPARVKSKNTKAKVFK